MMRCLLATPLMTLALAISLMGQSIEQSLPFVGCVSYGQIDKADAPTGVSVRRTFSRHDMDNLAYYKSAEIGWLHRRVELRRLFRFQRMGNVSQSRTDQRRTQMAKLPWPGD